MNMSICDFYETETEGVWVCSNCKVETPYKFSFSKPPLRKCPAKPIKRPVHLPRFSMEQIKRGQQRVREFCENCELFDENGFCSEDQGCDRKLVLRHRLMGKLSCPKGNWKRDLGEQKGDTNNEVKD